jgi:hypothetical protein
MPDVDLSNSSGESQGKKNLSFSLRRFASAIFFASIPLAVFCQFGSLGICGGILVATGLFGLTLRPKGLSVGLAANYFLYMFGFTLPVLLLTTAGGEVYPSRFSQIEVVQVAVLVASAGAVWCAYRQRFP